MLTASNALIKVTPGLMIWTIICFFITLFVLMQITARVSWDDVFANGVGSAPPQGAGHGR